MVKIRNISNPTADQVKELVGKSFPRMLGYEVEYFIGEDENSKVRSLCFSVTSKILGNIYRKTVKMRSSGVSSDYDEEFIGAVITDFILLGITFITQETAKRQGVRRVDIVNVENQPIKKGILNNNICLN